MTLEEAAHILSVNLETVRLHPSTARAAYRDAAKHCHPDSATPDAAQWQKLSEANRVIQQYISAPCPHCGGRGRVQVGAITRLCSACKGAG